MRLGRGSRCCAQSPLLGRLPAGILPASFPEPPPLACPQVPSAQTGPAVSVATVPPSPLCLHLTRRLTGAIERHSGGGSLELPLAVGAGLCCPRPCEFPLHISFHLWYPHTPFFFICHRHCFSYPSFNCPYSKIAASVCPLVGALISAAAACSSGGLPPSSVPLAASPGPPSDTVRTARSCLEGRLPESQPHPSAARFCHSVEPSAKNALFPVLTCFCWQPASRGLWGLGTGPSGAAGVGGRG